MQNKPDHIALGVIVIIATVCAMAFADAIVKYASSDLPLWQIYVVRSLIAIPALVGILICGKQPVRLRPVAAGWVALRSVLLALMYIAIYAALPVLDLSVMAASLYTGPLFIALLSAWLIGETVGLKRWCAIAIGFVGVLLVIKPATDEFSALALIPVIAALLYAVANIITRSRCTGETAMSLALALNFALLLVGAVASIALLVWQPTQAPAYPFLLGRWITMGGFEWSVIGLLAALMVAISTGLAKAYQSAPAAIIATFDYSYLIFAALFGFLLFAEVPDVATIAGMLLIAAAGLLVVRVRVRSAPKQARGL